MEFLFTNQIASIEAILLFLCIGVLASIALYDAYFYVRSVYGAFSPRRPTTPLLADETMKASAGDTPPSSDQDERVIEIPEDTPQNEEPVRVESPFLDETIVVDVAEQSGPIIVEGANEALPSEEDRIIPPSPENSNRDTDPLITGGDVTDSLDRDAPLDPTSEGVVGESEPILTVTPGDEVPHEDRESRQGEDLHSARESDTPPLPSLAVAPTPSSPSIKTPSDTPASVSKKPIKPEKRDKLVEIVSNIKTLIARGALEEARALIVTGLSIDKENRDLNILMAMLYEKDGSYKKAEYILKDVAHNFPDDVEVLTHLATDLAMQGKYDISYELYKRILVIGGEAEETLYTLSHLASEMNLPEDVVLYSRTYQKKFPNNPEILWIYSQGLIATGERKLAIETLIKLKNLTPYNQEIADLIQKLVTEEELAGNFGGEK